MEVINIFLRSIKWRFQNPITIIMTLIQPLIWLLLYSSVFASSMNGNYTAFSLAGILVLVVFASAGSSGVSNYFSKMEGSFYRIHISPVRRSSIVLGHILDAAALSFIEIIVLLVISFLMSVRIASGITGLTLMFSLLFMTIFFVASFSYMLSLILPNENVFHTAMNTFVLPIFFVSTALIPYDHIPDTFRYAVMANPFTHVINSIREFILSTAINWSGYAFAMTLMFILGIISFILAVKRLENDGKL